MENANLSRDFEMYSSLVRKGGIIAFHDVVKHPPYVDCEVEKFWNEIKNNYKFEELVKDYNQNWAGIGILFKK
jgi:predicted O-methyltransferase YrrM